MGETISKLLVNDCIQEHFEPPYCVNPLSVAEGKTLRLVIDLRHVNPCPCKHSFKYEDLHCLSKFLNTITGFSPGILSQGTITWIFVASIRNSWDLLGPSIVGFFFHFQGPSIWIEFCLFLFYEIVAPLSEALALDEPLLARLKCSLEL